MFRSAMVGILLIGFSSPSGAADPAKLPKELAIVPNDALGFASLNFTEAGSHPALKTLLDAIQKSPAQEWLLNSTGLKWDELDRATLVMPVPEPVPGERRIPEPEPIFLLTAKRKVDRFAILKAGGFYTLDEAKEIKKLGLGGNDKFPPPSGKAGASHYISRAEIELAFVDDRTLVIVNNRHRNRPEQFLSSPLERLKPKGDSQSLSAGVALAASKPIAFALNMPAMRQLIESDPPPNEMLPLFKADTAVGHAIIEKDAIAFSLVATYAGMQWSADAEETAKGLKTLAELAMAEDVKRTKKQEGDDSFVAKFQSLFVLMARGATIQKAGNEVTVRAKFDLGAETQKLFAALPNAMSETAGRTMSANNLKQIALALHNYHDSIGNMPTNTYDKAGKPLLSWRVQILPYLEQGPIFNEFKLDEPWDSETNKKLIERMPKAYALPGYKPKEPGMTHYRSFMSPKGATLLAIMHEGEGKGLGFVTITDGLSNTVFCVEADEPCVWTKPDDIPFDPKGKVAIRGGHFVKDRFQAALCDGSVRMMNAKMPEATLKAYITIAGGEVINDE